jgi:integrase
VTAFASHLAAELEAFVAFKRARGCPYVRAEHTLRNFDRFVLAHAPKRAAFRLDETILAWLASKAAERKAVTVTVELGTLRQFCLHRRRRDPRAFVPGRGWAPQSTESAFVPHVFSRAEVRRLLRMATALDGPPHRGLTLRTLLLVLYCTGLRFGEAVRLRVADVDVAGRVLFISESKGRSRWVPFDDSLALALADYAAARATVSSAGKPAGSFFLGRSGQPLRVKAASDAVRALLRASGLKPAAGRVGPRPYDFRHTFAVHRLTRWYRAGVDVAARLPWLSAYMGHDGILGTESYLRATPELLAIASGRFARRVAQAASR